MGPIEVLRGRTPEEVAQKFNQRENEGWKPLTQGTAGGEEPYFLSVYRPLDNTAFEQDSERPIQKVLITAEKLSEIYEKLREIYPYGKPIRSLREKEKEKNAQMYQRCRRWNLPPDKENKIAFLFPPDANMPMARLYVSLLGAGFKTVEDLLASSEYEYYKGIGKKGREAIKAIKEILLSENH